MANVLKQEKQNQLVALGQLGWTLRKIEDAVGVRRETVGKYLRAAGIVVRAPRRWGHGAAGVPGGEPSPRIPPPGFDHDPANELSTGSVVEVGANPAKEVSTGSRNGQVSLCEEHRAGIVSAMSLGRCAKVIWEDLRTEKGFEGEYATVKRYVRRLRAEFEEGGEADGVINTKIGEEAQVDYGEGPLVFDPRVGHHRRTRLFVMTLGWSRKAVRLLTFDSSALIWAELHERSFRRLGGAPSVCIPDNLGEGVKVPDYADPVLNAHYAAMLKHYSSAAVPAAVRDPDRKGKVESGVNHAQLRFVGKKFESLDAAQAYLDHWEEHFADTRIHGTTKRQVRAMFDEERPHLKPLPLEPWRVFKHVNRKVSTTGHVEIEGTYYEAPPSMLDTWVPIHFDQHVVRILDPKTQQLVIEHLREAGSKGTRVDRKETVEKRASASLVGLLKAANKLGTSAAGLCETIAGADIEELAQRRIRGVLGFARKHGAEYVDGVCAIAIEAGAPTHRFVKTYLDHHPPVPLVLKQVDPLIRELTQYRDVVARLTSSTAQETP